MRGVQDPMPPHARIFANGGKQDYQLRGQWSVPKSPGSVLIGIALACFMDILYGSMRLGGFQKLLQVESDLECYSASIGNHFQKSFRIRLQQQEPLGTVQPRVRHGEQANWGEVAFKFQLLITGEQWKIYPCAPQ
jgi:hypothetical protein